MIESGARSLDGRELVLGAGTVSLSGMCPSAAGRSYHPGMGRWVLRVGARWRRCNGRAVSLRARFKIREASDYCTRLEGSITTGGRRIPFVARRVVECGNGLREAGEQCDGQDGTLFGTDCCAADCRVKPGCPVRCFMGQFPCEDPDQICVYDCSFGGACAPRAEIDCGTTPVCDCSRRVTYANRCVAYDAGTGPSSGGPCPTP